MRSPTRPDQLTLLRCADAAGYAAVSWSADDAMPVAENTRGRARVWRLLTGLVRSGTVWRRRAD